MTRKGGCNRVGTHARPPGVQQAWGVPPGAVARVLMCSHSSRRVVCVGGDGMFSEVLHGLIGRTQRLAGVDPSQPRAALVASPLRIGIIPAGRGATWPVPHSLGSVPGVAGAGGCVLGSLQGPLHLTHEFVPT